MSEWWGTGYSNWTASEVTPAPLPVLPLAQREIQSGGWNPAAEPVPDASPGRRLRVFGSLVTRNMSTYMVAGKTIENPLAMKWTYLALLKLLEGNGGEASLSALTLRANNLMITERPAESRSSDPDLPPALQDLGDEINEDVRESLFTLDDPRHYYPGVDEGIEPVTDEHVEFVIWALQRELNRELRAAAGDLANKKLPAAPLAALSPAVQRALAERRRLRYLQYGIGRAQWLANTWSLWDVHEDPDWVPRRAERMRR